MSDRTREQRLRRKAERQGFTLEKCRRRDPTAIDFGTYLLRETEGWRRLDDLGGSLVITRLGRKTHRELRDEGRLWDWNYDTGRPNYPYGLTLDDVEAWLTGEHGSIRYEGVYEGKLAPRREPRKGGES